MKTRKTKNRLLSMLLTFVMVMTLLPATALAVTELDSVSVTLTPGLAAGVAPQDLHAFTRDSGIPETRYDVEIYLVYHGVALDMGDTYESNLLNDDEKLVEGEEYTIFLKFTPKDGYSLSDKTSATIKGESGKTYWYRKDAFGDGGIYRFVFTARAKIIELKSVSATLTAPVAGATPNDIKITSGDSSKYDVAVEGCYRGDVPDIQYIENLMDDDEKFFEGEEYSIFVEFIPKKEYSLSTGNTGTTATINGSHYNSYLLSNFDRSIIYKVLLTASAATTTEVESVSATVTAPVAGAKPDKTATVGDSDKYSVAAVSWKPSDSVFAESKSYAVLVELETKDGLKFAATPTVTINGKKAEIVSGGGSEKLEIRYTFPDTDVTEDMPFVDVPDDAYFKDAVIWAVDEGITKGASATTFEPNEICTRAQAATFLWRANGSPAPDTTKMPFGDVPTGSYYYKAVLWSVEQGIIKGTSSTTFSPDMNCSRAHIVTMLWRSEGSESATVANPFRDVASSDYFTDAVLWAVGKKVTEGTSAKMFSPDDNCTRAQIVTFIYRDKKDSEKG